jgi:hypothetical protein
MRRAASRYAGALAQYVSRLPWLSRTPSGPTGSASGWARLNHGGGDAVGVASTARTPWPASRSSTSSSQPKLYRPGAGSSFDQAKTPTVAVVTRARRISSASSACTSAGQDSGL